MKINRFERAELQNSIDPMLIYEKKQKHYGNMVTKYQP